MLEDKIAILNRKSVRKNFCVMTDWRIGRSLCRKFAGWQALKKRCRRLEKVAILGMIKERCETVGEAIRAGIASRRVGRANGDES
jgi:hypothetical protein